VLRSYAFGAVELNEKAGGCHSFGRDDGANYAQWGGSKGRGFRDCRGTERRRCPLVLFFFKDVSVRGIALRAWTLDGYVTFFFSTASGEGFDFDASHFDGMAFCYGRGCIAEIQGMWISSVRQAYCWP
jgi:hypothetical protein